MATEQHQSFATTHWSVVLAAGHDSSPGVQEALEKLCRSYWYPLYGYVRRQGHSPEDAQDLTQGFFARLLEKKFLQLANRERGKFRSFLLTSLKHFLVHEWERTKTAKRGGAHAHLSWDQASAEERYQLEPASELTPEKIFDQRWAFILFQQALTRLRDEYAVAGKGAQFDQLRNYLSAEVGDGGYASAAERLGMTTGAVAVAVHRLRQRYGELVYGEIAHTVANPAEIEDELRYLIGLISR